MLGLARRAQQSPLLRGGSDDLTGKATRPRKRSPRPSSVSARLWAELTPKQKQEEEAKVGSLRAELRRKIQGLTQDFPHLDFKTGKALAGHQTPETPPEININNLLKRLVASETVGGMGGDDDAGPSQARDPKEPDLELVDSRHTPDEARAPRDFRNNLINLGRG